MPATWDFYDEESADRLTDRELSLHIFHSDLSPEEKNEARNWSRFEKARFVRQRLPLSKIGVCLTKGIRSSSIMEP